MSLFVKGLKTNLSPEEFQYYQTQAKNYHKMYTKLIENKQETKNSGSNLTTNLTSESGNSTLQENIYNNPNNFSGELIKEKVMKWLFSMSLENRIKVATVENVFISYMIHQMYAGYKSDMKLIYQLKDEEKSHEKVGFKTGEISTARDEELLLSNIMNYFNYRSNRGSDSSMIEHIWLNDIKFFSLHSELDCVTLSPRVLKEEGLFSYYFKYIGHNNTFFSLVKPIQDLKNKFYCFSLPEWVDLKEFNTIGKWIAIFLEQTILIKYVLNYGRKEDKYIYSLVDEKRMSEFFQNRKDVLGCLSKYFEGDKKMELFNYIKPKTIYNDLVYLKEYKQKIQRFNKHFELGYKSFVSEKLNRGKDPCFYGDSDVECERKIIEKFNKENAIYFVDDTLFHSIDQLWKPNFFISTKLFEELHAVYTDKNYEELVDELQVSEKIRKNSNKKGKKATENRKKKGKNENSQVTYIKENKDEKPAKDPDYEFYHVYIDDNRHQINIQKNEALKSKSKSNLIMICDSSPAPKQELEILSNYMYKDQKDQLYGAYQNGQKNMIHNYIRNYLIKEIIENAVEKGKLNTTYKNSSCRDLMNDLCSISNKSKMINNILNNKKDTYLDEEDLDTFNLLSDNYISNEEMPVMRNNYMDRVLSEETNNTAQYSEVDREEKEDIVNYNPSSEITKVENNEELKSVDDTEVKLTVKELNEVTNKEEENIEKENNVKGKKKKKEQSFFLYDTSKKRKDKTTVINNTVNPNNAINTNTNNKITVTTPNTTVNSTSTINSKRNSTEIIENPSKKEKEKEFSNITIQPTGIVKEETKFARNSPNNQWTKGVNTNNSNIYNKNHYNKSKSNYSNHNYYNDSPNNRKYKSNNNYYYKNNYKHRNSDNSHLPHQSPSNNNYYIINSITHVNGNGNPMMMYMNPIPINPLMNPMNLNTQGLPMNSINNTSINNTSFNNNSFTPIQPITNMSSLVGNMNFNKFSNDFLTFVYKLHNDIVTYHKIVTETLESLKEVKVHLIQKIEKLINENISDEFSIDVYGSFASDLSIESSDIDIKIRLKAFDDKTVNPDFDLDQIILLLVKNFNALNIFECVIPIYTASVPIIKIVCDPMRIADDDNLMRLEEFRNSENYKNYKFNKEEIDKIKIDITFLDMIVKTKFNANNNIINNNPMSSVEFAKNKLILYPEIKPLLQVLKRFLQINKLNNSFNGGLSSFCLFLLILAFIKFKSISQPQLSQNNNLGRLLLDFLEFYGRMFNFHGCSIDVNLPNPFVMNTDIYDRSPIIFDPLSYLNASKSSFRIDEVRESFSEALEYLNLYKLKYDKIDVSASSSNIIYDLLLKK